MLGVDARDKVCKMTSQTDATHLKQNRQLDNVHDVCVVVVVVCRYIFSILFAALLDFSGRCRIVIHHQHCRFRNVYFAILK